jgi:hypothetical protein
MFCFAVVRIAYVAASIFEPPVDRLYSEIGERFMSESEAPTLERQAMVSVSDSVIESIEPAAQVEELPEPPVLGYAERVELTGDEMKSSDSAANTDALLNRMDTLRQEMAGCRIRRDEFYLQNNEEGYRREVEQMTELARESGEVGANL